MWAVLSGSYFPCEESVRQLEAAQYTIEMSQDRGVFFAKKDVNLDDLLVLPDSATETVLQEIEEFWSREEIYRKYRYLWKRGILLWGPPGSGKTTTVQLISKRIVERDGIAVYVSNPKIAAIGLKYLRKIEPKRPVVVMLEDLDTIVQNHEHEILALLDGELQIDNVVFVATTNYPEKLDRRIVNRPSRFDLVKKVPMPSAEARRIYLINREPDLEKQMRTVSDTESQRTFDVALAKLEKKRSDVEDRIASILEKKGLPAADIVEAIESGRKPRGAAAAEFAELKEVRAAIAKAQKKGAGTKEIPEVDYWVGQTEGFSVAHLKEVVLGVHCFGKPIDEVVKRMRAMMGQKPSSASGDASYKME
jgi:SpoVK/Ycf46/Vps4 family AAA+-type ATPase